MSRYDGGWPRYVPVAERRRKAERELEKLRTKGYSVAPIRIEGRTIVTSFWGKAWCDNLESYRDYDSRLPRGRSYVRNGSVVDLQIAPRQVNAVVSGSSTYRVAISIGTVPNAQWRSICADCSNGIDSVVELLQGRLSKGVMERLCRQDNGLFPKPSDIRFTCSCPDYASMCKHVAAVLYGVGARLDHAPELLFRLRAVDENDLVAQIGAVLPMAKKSPTASRVLDVGDVSALFGLDIVGVDAAQEPEGDASAGLRDLPKEIRKKANLVRAKATPGKTPAGRGPKVSVVSRVAAKVSKPATNVVSKIQKAVVKSGPQAQRQPPPAAAVVTGAAKRRSDEPRRKVAMTREPQPVKWWLSSYKA